MPRGMGGAGLSGLSSERTTTYFVDPRWRVALLKSLSADGRLRDAEAVFNAGPERAIGLDTALPDARIDGNVYTATGQVVAGPSSQSWRRSWHTARVSG